METTFRIRMNRIYKILSAILLLPVLSLNLSAGIKANCKMNANPEALTCCPASSQGGAGEFIPGDNCCCTISHSDETEDRQSSAALSEKTDSEQVIENSTPLLLSSDGFLIAKQNAILFFLALSSKPAKRPKIYQLNLAFLI